MYAIKAIYDGISFKPLQPIPVKENYEVVITFIEPVKKEQTGIMKNDDCTLGLRGLFADCPEMSVDRFLERKHADKELDI